MGGAMSIINEKSNLPAVCGRVCPHERQCEGHCILNKKQNPIRVGKLERFIADFDSDMNNSNCSLNNDGKLIIQKLDCDAAPKINNNCYFNIKGDADFAGAICNLGSNSYLGTKTMTWATSGGTTSQDWYSNSNADQTYLYTK